MTVVSRPSRQLAVATALLAAVFLIATSTARAEGEGARADERVIEGGTQCTPPAESKDGKPFTLRAGFFVLRPTLVACRTAQLTLRDTEEKRAKDQAKIVLLEQRVAELEGEKTPTWTAVKFTALGVVIAFPIAFVVGVVIAR